tara:strand:- start:17190 stop:17351 length:162 start_codon:yes stop_codon:yes gene_type:complete
VKQKGNNMKQKVSNIKHKIQLQDLKEKQAPCGMGEPVIAGVIVAVVRSIVNNR